MVYIHHFGTMTHTPGKGNFTAKTPTIENFSVVSFIVKSLNTSYLIEFSCTVNLHDVLYETAQC